MNAKMAWPSVAVFAVWASMGCRDASSTQSKEPSGPSFDVAVSDTDSCAPSHCRFKSTGEFVEVSWFDPGTPPGDTSSFPRITLFGSLSVSRNGSKTDARTFMSFSLTECRGDFNCTTTGGFGTIPNEDFTGTGRSMRVVTNTTGNPNFFTFGGGTGAIEVTWSSNGSFESSSNGTTETRTPTFRQHTTGQSTFVSATASGFVLSRTIVPGNFGRISTSRNVTIDIFH